jgi:hypothetical protein
MPQKLTQATVNKLIKGLITEAGELTFPEDASVDELNCVLNRDGSRQRRKGLEQVFGSSTLAVNFATNGAYSQYHWKNVGGYVGLSFVVVQASSTIYFIDPTYSPITSGLKSFSIDLTSYAADADETLSRDCQFTDIFGTLVVVSAFSQPLVVKYDKGTDSISIEEISFKVRDFKWLSPMSLLPVEATPPISIQRKYDTFNAGWNGPGYNALQTYNSYANNYPPLSIPWFSAKDEDNNFSYPKFNRYQQGSSTMGNGSYILDFFNKDRNTAAGVIGIPDEVESNRFSTVAEFAGRVWYAGLGSGVNSGKVLFTQAILNSNYDNTAELFGICHQINDPTAEYLSDILDTDGGEILISEANNIKKLHPYNDSLFVFAENGVWLISGIDNRFTPSSYYISKVSSTGIDSAQSFVSAENIPFWWSNSGIHTIRFDESNGFPIEENISLPTIQSFFGELTPFQRSRVVSDYDSFNKRLYWWYPSSNDAALDSRGSALVLDIVLKAFYPWQVAETSTKRHVSTFYLEPTSAITNKPVVTVASGTVTVGSGDVFVLAIEGGEYTDDRLISIYADSGYKLGQFSDEGFQDFGTEDYDSYFESGYFFGGDLLLKKSAPYVTVYLRSTEDGFTGNETDGYSAINPSGLLLKTYWDFKSNSSSSQQAYRIKPFAIVNTSDLSNNQQDRSVVVTRLKVRGRGRSMRLRFEAEPEKDFIFLGYSVLVGINERF